MVKVAPSILSADFATLGEEVRRVERAGADWVHVDVMDGQFVPNITIGPGVVRSIRPHTKLPLDVHLMIVRPENFVEAFARAGADLITIHLEASKNVAELLLQIKSLGKGAGISINPGTPFEKVLPFMEHIDLLLIMTVNPGFGGQPFMHECLDKIRQAREHVDRHHLCVEIEVDGGINAQTGKLAVQAGASVLAAGNALFGAPDMRKEISIWKRF
ncbi:MAG: ribulose-phosphate 3-epimerase [Methanomassiliicoccales archaeon]|nr:ribulose-phosphate 3-epimerase [Methanomassiliicoccales archaeon]MDD1756167.1 ribulose-phosphate 3-epimerase [Methanomassiliicoccales archaeon]